MLKLPKLQIGDSIEIIAPASRCSDKHLKSIKDLIISWGLKCILPEEIFGDDLLCANTDETRFRLLKNALQNTTTHAVLCARGGYGSMRLIPELSKLQPPTSPKLFIGMSDITALNLFLQQTWQWPTLHGALAIDKFSEESINTLKSILFGHVDFIEFLAKPLNSLAKTNLLLDAPLIGGNLCLVQTSIGTTWQINAKNKIVFLEEVGERGYRVDRMLEHLRQANIFNGVKAIVFGDFLEGKEPNNISLIEPVLERFASSCKFPVVKIEGVGHGHTNLPLPLGTSAQLKLGGKSTLTCFS